MKNRWLGVWRQWISVSRLASESGCQVMPIFQYRFGHGLQKLKYLVDQKLAGEAFVFNVDVAWWRDSEYYRNPWRGKRATELGGALLSQAIHAVDMVLYILGPAKSVFGRTTTRVNQIEVEDCVAIATGNGRRVARHDFRDTWFPGRNFQASIYLSKCHCGEQYSAVR